jgi:hypothetical protein
LCPRRDLLVRRELRVSDSAQATVASPRLAAPRCIDPAGLPRARWSPRRSAEGQARITRTRGPSTRGNSPAAGPGGPCRFVRVIWVPHTSSHRIVDRAGPGSTWPQWRGRKRARGGPLPPVATDALRGPRGRPPNAPSRTRHRLDPRATDREGALGAVMLPHGAQGSGERSAPIHPTKLTFSVLGSRCSGWPLSTTRASSWSRPHSRSRRSRSRRSLRQQPSRDLRGRAQRHRLP